MSWSRLNCDLSFTEKVKIHKLFPKINCCYPIKLEWEEYYPEGKKAFFLWQPPHSELTKLPIYSARISKDYRAVEQLDGDTIIWFWIGFHTDYNKLLVFEYQV